MRGWNVVSFVYWLIFQVYHYAISPLIHLLSGFGFGCRFHPTCSEYAFTSIRENGLLAGTLHSVRRFSRCHPFSRAPFYDPVVTTGRKYKENGKLK
ncbi:MAG: membrane protein insertion efficiency factor YidD [Oligoflexia bacterium]|nr:membrane protein insertion efficiency factor YidD [Oligoflexia bacterium]